MTEKSELDQLAALAADADAGAAASDPVTPEQEAIATSPDYQKEAMQTVEMLGAMIVGYAPDAVGIWTPETTQSVGKALAPVLEKYGVTLGTLPPELYLVMMAAMPLYQSAKIVALQMQSNREKAAQSVQVQNQTTQEGLFRKPENSPNGVMDTATAQSVHDQMKLYER
ncbi:MAG: hypothetical protein ACXWJD_04005 [Burkholderiaceae bacterium]